MRAVAMTNVCAIQLWSSKSHTPDDNRAHAIDMLRRAAASAPDDRPHDLIVLPEAVAMLCYPDDRPSFTYDDVAEDVPGRTSNTACRIAKEAGSNVIIGLIQRRDDGCQNVTVVIDRNGEIVGMYEKMNEPEVCIREQAALEGSKPGLFDLDFGRVGIFVCWDLEDASLPKTLADGGADLLVFPHLMSFANERSQARRIREAARSTGLPLVAAGMRDEHNHNAGQSGLWPTAILDGDGTVIRQTVKAKADLVDGWVDLGN